MNQFLQATIVSKKVRGAVNFLHTKNMFQARVVWFWLTLIGPRRMGKADIQHRSMPGQMRLCDMVLCTKPMIYGNWIG
jgi:hypothetical protein